MKNFLKAVGIIALVAVIGFSMAACETELGDGGLPAPTGLKAPVVTSTVILLAWNEVPGASGYILYGSYSPSSGFENLNDTFDTDLTVNSCTLNLNFAAQGKTMYFRVSAITNREESAKSDYVRVVVPLNSTTSSLNGTWKRDRDGLTLSVSGSSGTYVSIGTSLLYADAVKDGYIKIGDQKWRNLAKTADNNKWSGQELLITENGNKKNDAIGSGWHNITIIISADGNTLGTYTPDNSTVTYDTWTRQ